MESRGACGDEDKEGETPIGKKPVHSQSAQMDDEESLSPSTSSKAAETREPWLEWMEESLKTRRRMDDEESLSSSTSDEAAETRVPMLQWLTSLPPPQLLPVYPVYRREMAGMSTASLHHSPVDNSELKLDPNKANVKLDTDPWMDNLPFTRDKYSAARVSSSLPEAEAEHHQRSELKHKFAASSSDSDLTPDPKKTTQIDWWSLDEPEEIKTPSRFTPELVVEDGVTSYRFKGLCPGVFQCDLTGLVFTMTRQGEVLYRIIQWDEGLLLSAKKVPASPLFNIQGSEDAVSHLHLPHCEIQPSERNKFLHVAHIGDDGMSILQPVQITDTHVVVSVPHFSAFGLVWDVIMSFLNIHKPISGQVLLFHRLYTRQTRKLNVFLLPENVPLQEVKKQQENAEYIEAPSSCHLISGQTYSLHCPEAYKIQPECASFELKYGPNYHPTFEIRLSLSTEEATVTVQDHEGRPAWKYHVELNGLTPALTSPALSTPSPVSDPAWLPFATKEIGPDLSRQKPQKTQNFTGKEEEKLFSVRTEFVNRVSTSVIKDLLDKLLQERVVNSGEMESIHPMTRAEKARELIDMVLRKGQLACKILIDAFCELDPFLSEFLQLK